MIDYLLRFDSKEQAVSFGLSNGFVIVVDGVALPVMEQRHICALSSIGEWEGDGKWWILFRDAVGIEILPEWKQFIAWKTSDGTKPESVPQVSWSDL